MTDLIKNETGNYKCTGCGSDFATPCYYQRHKDGNNVCMSGETVGLVLQRIGKEGGFHYVDARGGKE